VQLQQDGRGDGAADAVHDELLDKDDKLVGLVKDKEEVEKRLRPKLLPRNAWQLIPFFELFMFSPKDELHQWLVVCTCLYLVCTDMY
jgi:hypothetical protein